LSPGVTYDRHYDDVFWFPSLPHDLMINDIPLASEEPVGKNPIASGMKLVFGCIGTQAFSIRCFLLDGCVVWHRGLM
jgi:hypothetical protein